MSNPIYFKGKDIIVYANGIAVGCDKSSTIEVTTKTADTTTKCSTDSNGNLWGSVLPITNTWKISGNGLTVLGTGDSGGMNEYSTGKLLDLQFAQTKIYVTWIRGAKTYGGDAYVTSMKETAPSEDVVSYDYTFDGTGPISEIPVS